MEIEPNYPQECGEVLSLIGDLYGVERLAPRLAGLQVAAATIREPAHLTPPGM